VGKLASPDCFKAGIATSREQFVQQLQEAAKPPSILSHGDCVLTAQLKDGCKLQVGGWGLAAMLGCSMQRKGTLVPVASLASNVLLRSSEGPWQQAG
jgi:hypothetical protein